MSTRCQVCVTQTGMRDWEDTIMLYHHSDGYPDHMIPCIKRAFDIGAAEKPWGGFNLWRLGRAGKAASFLCASDPGIMEPESSLDLHCDIEYFYQIECVNENAGSSAERGKWIVRVYATNGKFNGGKYNPKRLAGMKLIDTMTLTGKEKN